MKLITMLLPLFLVFILNTNLCADVSEDDIEAIYMRTVTRYGLGGVYITNASYLLLKNGDIFDRIHGSPYKLDIAESKKTQAKDWGTWKRRGKKIVVKDSDGDENTWENWHETVPAKKGETLSGSFQSSDPFTGGKAFNVNTIIFNKNGQYAAARVKGGETSWKSIVIKSNNKGTYVLDRYSITLKPEGKPAESFVFFFYPDKHNYFVIGRSHFVPLDD